MLKPKKVAQTLPDEDGNTVTYYVLYSEERDRYMIDVHFTGEMDSDLVQGLILSFIDDCQAVKQDMFEMVDISSPAVIH